jgi:hypothetical protein
LPCNTFANPAPNLLANAAISSVACDAPAATRVATAGAEDVGGRISSQPRHQIITRYD